MQDLIRDLIAELRRLETIERLRQNTPNANQIKSKIDMTERALACK